MLTLINEDLWHSHEKNFAASGPANILFNEFENYTFEIPATFPRANELMMLRWVTTKKQKWCQFLENLHKYSLKYIGFNHAKQIMGYHACFWDILTYITHEIETKPHIITHLG